MVNNNQTVKLWSICGQNSQTGDILVSFSGKFWRFPSKVWILSSKQQFYRVSERFPRVLSSKKFRLSSKLSAYRVSPNIPSKVHILIVYRVRTLLGYLSSKESLSKKIQKLSSKDLPVDLRSITLHWSRKVKTNERCRWRWREDHLTTNPNTKTHTWPRLHNIIGPLIVNWKELRRS